MARLKIAPQRGHAVALAEIMARQTGHDVILVMALPRTSLFVQSIGINSISSVFATGHRREPRPRPQCLGPSEARSASQQPIELAVEHQRVGIDDLLGGEDFFELAVVGLPAHPLRFFDVIADARPLPRACPEA
jgi:hypothetical protein